MNKNNWKYNDTFTVRIPVSTKERLWAESERQGVPFSTYIRDVLESSLLPDRDNEEKPLLSARELVVKGITSNR